jgi:hypothetical protein
MWLDGGERVSRGMYDFDNDYMARRHLRWRNTTLHNAGASAASPTLCPPRKMIEKPINGFR